MVQNNLRLKLLNLDEDKAQSLRLMKTVYGKESEVSNETFYDWQYKKNPAGLAQIAGFFDGDNLVSQVASIPSLLSIDNIISKFPMTLNIATHPKFRGKRLVSTLFEYLYQKNFSSLFTFGMPNSNSLKLHMKLDYSELKIPLLFKMLKSSGILGTSLFSPFDKLIFKHNEKVLDEVSISNEIPNFLNISDQSDFFRIRDSKYLKWRYQDIPTRKYQCLIHKANSNNFLIIRHMAINNKKITTICEFESENSFSQALIHAACFHAIKENESEMIIGGFFEKNFPYQQIKKNGFFKLPENLRPHPLALCIKYLQLPNYSEINKPAKWYFSMGDFDVF